MVDEHHLNQILAILHQLGDKHALHEPCFTGNEWVYTKECLDTGWVSSVGKFVDRFERDLADFTGAQFAIATVNGTAALHISYLLAGVKSGDEVLVPTMTFVATINALTYCGATPHFVDCEEVSLGIDPVKLENYLSEIASVQAGVCINRFTGKIIRGVCLMHALGHPADIDAISDVCERYQLVLIEDAAEALGSYYKGVHVGHRGVCGTLSFNGNKIITTGGGGAILTNDADLAKRAKHLTTTAKRPHAWEFEHDSIAYNYRLPNINAAIGCAQLEKLPEFLRAKRLLAKTYDLEFSNIPFLKFLREPPYAKSNYWLNAIILDEQYAYLQHKLLVDLNQSGQMSRPLWNLMHQLPMYQHCPKMDLSTAESLRKRLVKIPSSAKIGMNIETHHKDAVCL